MNQRTLPAEARLRVLVVTSEWPTVKNPEWAPYIVEEVDHLRQNGITVKVYPFRGNKNPLNFIKNWVKLRREIDFSQYDLIHAQFGQSALIVIPSPISLVVTFRGSDLHGWINQSGTYTYAGKLLGHISSFVAGHADQVILVSEHLANYIPASVRYNVISGGIDLDLFQPSPKDAARQELKLPLHKRLVLFAASPDNPIKRYDLAQRACQLLESESDLELVVLSGVPHKKVPLYMNACDALLLTSKHEGSPTVVKEALACNLAVVSVDVGEVKKQIDNVAGCRLCSDDSPQTIAADLGQVLEDLQPVQGRQAVAHLSWENTTHKIIEVYREAINSKKELSKKNR